MPPATPAKPAWPPACPETAPQSGASRAARSRLTHRPVISDGHASGHTGKAGMASSVSRDGTASGASRAARSRVSDAEPEALPAGEVGGDHQRAAVALEAASDRAHADRAVPGVEQV